MKKVLLLFITLLLSLGCRSQHLDSSRLDLNLLYNKLGNRDAFRIMTANAKAAFAILKASDSLYYILEPEKIHGPFYLCTPLNGSNLFLILHESTSEQSIYETFSQKEIEITDHLYQESFYPYRSGRSVAYKLNKEFYILQDDGQQLGPFPIAPALLFSDSVSTLYEVFKDNYEFELYAGKTSLGTYRLLADRYHNWNSDFPRTDLTVFKNKSGQFFYSENGKLNGPYKDVIHPYMSAAPRIGYSVYKYLYQREGEDFYTLNWRDSLLQIDLDRNLTHWTFQIFPDSSLTTEATNIKKFSFLRQEPELYYYNTRQGLIEPFPVNEKNFISPTHRFFTPLSKYAYYYDREYPSSVNGRIYYIFNKNRYIDSLYEKDLRTMSIVGNNLFYKKDSKDYMNGKLINVPYNEAVCIYKKDTFFVVKRTPSSWELYKNRKIQKTTPLRLTVDNLRHFSFQYAPATDELFLDIETGYGEGMSMYCPNKCYGILYDIKKNLQAKYVRYAQMESQNLSGTNPDCIDLFPGGESDPKYALINQKKYPYCWIKQLENYSNNEYELAAISGSTLCLYHYYK
jgi:hypothetical protein